MLLCSGHAPSLHPSTAKHLQRADYALSSPPSYHSLRPSGSWLHPVTDTVFVRQTLCTRLSPAQSPHPYLAAWGSSVPPLWNLSPLTRLHTPGLFHLPGCSSSVSAAPPQPLDDGVCGAPSLGSVLTSSFAMLSPQVILARSTV